jgi:hypothetical protein
MVAQHMMGPAVELGFIEKRKGGNLKAAADPFSHQTNRYILATANGAGSTTTLVCANATPAVEGASMNVARVGESFRLFTAAGVVKEETVFTITAIAVAGSTTITFTPAAAGATASTDVAKLVGSDSLDDSASLDATLTKLAASTYTSSVLNSMNDNDKVFAIRSIVEQGAL